MQITKQSGGLWQTTNPPIRGKLIQNGGLKARGLFPLAGLLVIARLVGRFGWFGWLVGRFGSLLGWLVGRFGWFGWFGWLVWFLCLIVLAGWKKEPKANPVHAVA